jgi:hypothetical protein
VEKGPDVSIKIDDGTMVPCQGTSTAIIDNIDDVGHPLRLKFPILCMSQDSPKAFLNLLIYQEVQQQCPDTTTVRYLYVHSITLHYCPLDIYKGAPSACQVEISMEVPTKPYTIKYKTAEDSD